MKKIYLFSFCLSLLLSSNSQTIPCPGFENWVNSNESGTNYLVPQNWITVDQAQNAFTPTYTGISSLQTTSKNSGQYAVLMQTSVSGGDTVSGGIISHASLATFFSAVFGGGNALGFSYALRSANLQGYFKFTGVSGDSGFIALTMTKWNTSQQKRDTLAVEEKGFGVNATNYTFFSIPITYSLNLFPDTVVIIAAIDGPNGQTSHIGTQFYLDDLTFSGTVPVGIKENLYDNNYLRIYPNPFSGTATLELSTAVSLNNARVIIYDAWGREVKTLHDFASYTVPLDRGELQSGIYFYRLLDEGEIITDGKFIIE